MKTPQLSSRRLTASFQLGLHAIFSLKLGNGLKDFLMFSQFTERAGASTGLQRPPPPPGPELLGGLHRL